MKYLELIKGQFTAEHEARAKQEEPYVAYSEEAGGVMYNFIPEPVVGPADNEIWFTGDYSDGDLSMFVSGEVKSMIVGDSCEDGKGVLTFKNSITSIPVAAFSGCGLVTSFILPNSVTSIGNTAFDECYELHTITIPVSVMSIGMYAFQFCESLQTINFIGTMEQWNAVEKGKNWNGY